MRRGARAWVRAVGVALALVTATAACQVDVQVRAKVNPSGAGTFSVRLQADRELIDLARSSGEDPLKALVELPDPLPRGWRVSSSTPDGGLLVTLERAFSSPADLNAGLAELDRAVAAKQGPTASFYSLRLERTTGFMRSRTSVAGNIDLTANGLLGAAGLSPETADQLRTLVSQTASEFFRFTVRAELPGRVSSSSGRPTKVEGGTITWSPELGKTLSFSASSSAYKPAGLAVIGVPAILVLLLIVAGVARRRRIRRRRSSRASADRLDTHLS